MKGINFMTTGPMPKWWKEAEPYFNYDTDELEISEKAPKELQEKFREYKKQIRENNNMQF